MLRKMAISTYVRGLAFKNKTRLTKGRNHFDFTRDNRVLRISFSHMLYAKDIIESFDYYFGAVEPITYSGYELVDYSLPKYHDVIGYDKHPIFFPSFSEPISTTSQYISFAQLQIGSVVIDLGAYSGLTSILFKELVGPSGVVIAVDADERNFQAIKKNCTIYERVTGNTIENIFGAVWKHDDGLDFSVEGNMGSSATSITGTTRGAVTHVKSFRLNSLANMFDFKTIDFIKCDIEGAEAIIFDDDLFFSRFLPRILVEPHIVNGEDTSDMTVQTLAKYGYTHRKTEQIGGALPLLEFYPPKDRREADAPRRE